MQDSRVLRESKSVANQGLKFNTGAAAVEGDVAEEVDGLGVAELDNLEQGNEAKEFESRDLARGHGILFE